MTREKSLWQQKVDEDPGHSRWYVERFRRMADEGADLVGEARLVDAMVPRGSRVLDAGCGPGRHAGHLHRAGHVVVGVDGDPVLIEAARVDHPGPTWLVADLTDLDLPASGVAEPFDAILCAGNVMTFLAPSTRVEVLRRLASHLAPTGRAVIGFGTDRGYPVEEFFDDARAAGLSCQSRFSTWHLDPFDDDADFLVAVLTARSGR